MSFRIDPQEMREQQQAREIEAVREFIERDVKSPMLARAVFECRLIALGKTPVEIAAMIAQYSVPVVNFHHEPISLRNVVVLETTPVEFLDWGPLITESPHCVGHSKPRRRT